MIFSRILSLLSSLPFSHFFLPSLFFFVMIPYTVIKCSVFNTMSFFSLSFSFFLSLSFSFSTFSAFYLPDLTTILSFSFDGFIFMESEGKHLFSSLLSLHHPFPSSFFLSLFHSKLTFFFSREN